MNELAEVVKNFKDGKAPGLNNFPMSTAKKSFSFICEPLLYYRFDVISQ